MAILKYDKVTLIKEFGKMNMVGEAYEIANISDDSFVIRDTNKRVALGVISFEEFNKHFKKVEDVKGWTPWVKFMDEFGNADFYRTNFRKVEVKAFGKRASAACNLAEDEFNLHFGLQLAYCRCLNKMLLDSKKEHQEALKMINSNIKDNRVYMHNMINSLIKDEEKVEK